MDAQLGHVAEDFGFAWWDHCFNKAAKKIQVEHCQEVCGGIGVGWKVAERCLTCLFRVWPLMFK